jgi:chemotaxis protein MotA
MIVIGGTIGAVGVTIPTQTLKNVLVLFKIAFSNKKRDLNKTVDYFEELAQRVRKDGALQALEQEVRNPDLDDFTKDGLNMVVDSVQSEEIRNAMEEKVEQIKFRHRNNQQIFKSAGGYGPTMGIIGTVMGLVHVLANLDDADTLGPKIAVAFLATLYGISTANLIYLPIAGKLEALSANEVNYKYMVIEGLMQIAAGASPASIGEKLRTFIIPKDLKKK